MVFVRQIGHWHYLVCLNCWFGKRHITHHMSSTCHPSQLGLFWKFTFSPTFSFLSSHAPSAAPPPSPLSSRQTDWGLSFKIKVGKWNLKCDIVIVWGIWPDCCRSSVFNTPHKACKVSLLQRGKWLRAEKENQYVKTTIITTGWAAHINKLRSQ